MKAWGDPVVLNTPQTYFGTDPEPESVGNCVKYFTLENTWSLMVVHSPQFRPQAVPVVTSLLPALCRTDGCEWEGCGMNRLMAFWGTQNLPSLLLCPHWRVDFLGDGKDEETSLPSQWMLFLLQTHELHLIWVIAVNPQGFQAEISSALSFARGMRTRLCTTLPQLGTSGLNHIQTQDEECVVFCLAVHSRYPNLKQHCLPRFCFFLCLPCEKTHPFWSCPFHPSL